MPVDLKNKPDEESGLHGDWYKPESDPLENAYDAPSASDDDLPEGHPSRSDSNPVSNKGLDAAEKKGASGEQPTGADRTEQGGLFRKELKGKGPLGKLFGSKKGKWIGVGVGGSIVGLTMGGFFLLPLKTMHMVTNLQETFFANSEEAAERATNRLLSSYIVYKVIPGLSGTCPSTRADRSCAKVNQDDNIVTQLYRSWRDQNLESKMYEKHGIEFRRDGNNYSMHKRGETLFLIKDGGNFSETEGKLFAQLDRKEIRKEMLKSIENETFYKRMMYRYKYGRLMERKYGVIRCVIACEYRQDRADRKELRKIKMKAWVIQRVLGPLNEGYALAFECMVAEFNCANESDATVDEDGSKKTTFENQLRDKTKEVIGDGRMTKERLAQLQADAGDVKDNGLASFLLKKIMGEAGGRIAGGTIAGVGLVDMLSSLVEGISKAGPAIKAMQYAMSSGAAVQVWTMYQTNTSEIRSGNINVEELGYAADSLGDGFGTDQGGGGAEATAYYQDIMGSQGVSTASLFPKAEAASPFKCDDGSYLTTGLCPEMSVGATTSGANAVKELGQFFDDSGLSSLASIWNSTVGQVFDALGEFIGWLTDPLGDVASALTPDFIKEKAAEIAKALATWFTEKLFVSFMTDDTSGGRMFEAAALGANIAGNDFAHLGLGAGKIGDQMANDVRYTRALEKKQEFMDKPLFARMFDTSSSYSTVSQLALAMPSGTESATRSLSSTLLNPVSIISSTLTSSKKVNAAPIQNLDLAGVTQYGYAANDPIFTEVTDYEKWWTDNNCDDESVVTKWGESATLNPKNGSFENDQPNRCKLIEAMSTSNCGYTNDECLTPEELGDPTEYEAGTETGGNLRLASLNVLGHCHTKPGCGSYNKPGYESGEVRMRKQMELWDKHKIDVVGLQEFEPPQRQELMRSGSSTWAIFPTNPDYDQQFSKQSIVWRKGTYELEQGGGYLIPYGNNNNQLKVAWAILKISETGTKFRVINTHDPADAQGNAQMRYQAVQEHIRRTNEFKGDGIPIFIIGDFNANTNTRPNQPYYEGKRENSAYCQLTSGYYKHAYDIANNSPDRPCPTTKSLGIDHIFAPKDADVTLWKSASSEHTADHPLVFADISFGDGGSDGWSWPLKSRINDGPCYGGKPQHAGMDMNSEIADNPVYAMHSGKVVRKGYDADGAGNYITILADAPFNNKKVYYSYEHLKTGSVKLGEGDRVLGGAQVGITGLTGDTNVGSSLAHLHIVTATTNTLGAYGSPGTTFNPMEILKNAGPAPEGYKCYVPVGW